MLLVGKQFDEEKKRLYHSQNGICPLCGRELNADITSNPLDHDHALTGPNAGRVRALLCLYCNCLEGEIKHKFVSSGLASRDVDMVKWLKTLIDYYETDISQNRIHKQYVPDKTKWFSRLNKPEMLTELELVNAPISEKMTKAQMVEVYRKALRAHIK